MSKKNTKAVAGYYEPGLYVTATPIGNLGDMSFRARDILGLADIIACEDTRVTGRLLAHFDLKTPMVAYHDHNERLVMPQLLDRMAHGARVALVSDAGTPLISDPGYRLVRAARDANIPVHSLPGACALLAALTAAGLPTDRFMFAGFLPPKKQARQKILTELAELHSSLIFYESPKRLARSLQDMAEILGNRQAAVCRELTKLFEEIKDGTLPELAAYYDPAYPPKGEIVVVIAPPLTVKAAEKTDTEQLDRLLRKTLNSLSLKDAVAAVVAITDMKRKQVYARALAINTERNQDRP